MQLSPASTEEVAAWVAPKQDAAYPTSYFHLGSFTVSARVQQNISILPCILTVHEQGFLLGLWESSGSDSFLPTLALKTAGQGSAVLFGLARLAKKGKIFYTAKAAPCEKNEVSNEGGMSMLSIKAIYRSLEVRVEDILDTQQLENMCIPVHSPARIAFSPHITLIFLSNDSPKVP